MRKIGKVREIVPFVYICFIIGSLAITGFPFLTGYYSKDLILEFTYSRYVVDATFIYFLGLTSAICTAIYSFRIIYYIFSSNNLDINSSITFYKHFSTNNVECPPAMFIAMSSLAFASIVIGYISSDLIIGVGISYWQDSLYVLPEHFQIMDVNFVDPLIKNCPIILSIIFAFFAGLICYFIEAVPVKGNKK